MNIKYEWIYIFKKNLLKIEMSCKQKGSKRIDDNVPRTRSSSDSDESVKSATAGKSAVSFSAFPELNWGVCRKVAVPLKDAPDVTDAASVDMITSGSRQSSRCVSVSTGNYSPKYKQLKQFNTNALNNEHNH